MPLPPNDDPISLLCTLASAGGGSFPELSLRRQYGESVAYLKRLGALSPSEPLTMITCQACDEDHSTLVEYDPSTRRHHHFCPYAGKVALEDTDLTTLYFDSAWLIAWLEDALPIQYPRHYRTMIDGQAWHLGTAILQTVEISVVLALRLSTAAAIDGLTLALETLRPQEVGLVLTMDERRPQRLVLPYRFMVLSLADILKAEPAALIFDHARLSAWIKRFSRRGNTPAKEGPGRPSDKDLVLCIYRERKQQGIAYETQAAEARAIKEEFKRRHPKKTAPAVKTIAAQLRRSVLCGNA